MTSKEVEQLALRMNAPVTNISEFKTKYGEIGWTFAIEEFIKRAPPFLGASGIAGEINRMVADLKAALKNIPIV